VTVANLRRREGGSAIHRHGGHAHIPPGTVLAALGVTLVAAAVELVAAWHGSSRFLVADAVHLVAHLGIFGVLLIPTARWHESGEDMATITVLTFVLLIAVGITVSSLRALTAVPDGLPDPSFMLVALLGLGANMTTAYLFKDPAATRWSFRAALAHELSDGALTIAGLAGALCIRLFSWRWVDPGLSLAIGAWLGAWSTRLLARRFRQGRAGWMLEEER
jgi:cobalt-zinc-cadmium efflux system protein